MCTAAKQHKYSLVRGGVIRRESVLIADEAVVQCTLVEVKVRGVSGPAVDVPRHLQEESQRGQ